jgi:hypothetical protein
MMSIVFVSEGILLVMMIMNLRLACYVAMVVETSRKVSNVLFSYVNVILPYGQLATAAGW